MFFDASPKEHLCYLGKLRRIEYPNAGTDRSKYYTALLLAYLDHANDETTRKSPTLFEMRGSISQKRYDG
jgi:hypothetical protein